ncbi:helix-turn-helix domain-containing protein [Candidatus Nomurabacteria bacterium]|nr:helix-turn-helix domain-containing protein [Candidatus Nomurabacteria bacterium]
MIEQLFGSNTRFKLLWTFFQNPEKPYYIRQLTRALDVQINAIRRELEILEQMGIITTTDHKPDDLKSKVGSPKRKYYVLNTSSLIFPELKALYLKERTIGQEGFFSDLKDKAGDLKLLLLTGMFTGAKSAPTDLFVVGKVKPKILDKLISQYEKDYGVEVRYTVMTEDEFKERRYVMDKFVFEVFEGAHVELINNLQND